MIFLFIFILKLKLKKYDKQKLKKKKKINSWISGQPNNKIKQKARTWPYPGRRREQKGNKVIWGSRHGSSTKKKQLTAHNSIVGPVRVGWKGGHWPHTHWSVESVYGCEDQKNDIGGESWTWAVDRGTEGADVAWREGLSDTATELLMLLVTLRKFTWKVSPWSPSLLLSFCIFPLVYLFYKLT